MAVDRRPIFGEQQRFMLFLIAPAALLVLLFQVAPIGIVNAVLEGLGLEGQPWLVQRWTAFGVILLTEIWLWTPWLTLLLLLAGLQSLPKEPFEAAEMRSSACMPRCRRPRSSLPTTRSRR